MTHLTSKELKVLMSLCLIFALRMLGLFIIFPIFSTYATQLSSVTPFLTGVALGIYGLTQALLQIPFGLASDRLGRKPLLRLGLLLLLLGSVVAALSDSIYGIIIGRALQGASAIGCVIMALIADSISETVRVRAMAVVGITIGLSFALAMVLGPLLTVWIGTQNIFWLVAFLALLAMLLVEVFIQTDDEHTKAKNKTTTVIPLLSKIPTMLLYRPLMPFYFGILILHASLVMLFLKIPVALKTLGFSTQNTWHFYLPIFLASLLTTMPYLKLIEKKTSAKRGLTSLVILFGISVWSILYSLNTLIGLGISLWVFFTVFNTLEASLPAWISVYAPRFDKGTALGIFSSAQFLGLFLGGVLGGYLDTQYGTIGIMGFCMAVTIIWLLWQMWAIENKEVAYGKRS